MRYQIVVFVGLFFSLHVCAAQPLTALPIVQEQAGPGLQIAPLFVAQKIPAFTHALLYPLPTQVAIHPVSVFRPGPTPKAYSYEKLSLFCKWEVRMERTAKFPIKVRLGDVQTVDRLEGKN